MFFGAIAFGASPFSDVGFNPDAKVQISGQSLTLTLSNFIPKYSLNDSLRSYKA